MTTTTREERERERRLLLGALLVALSLIGLALLLSSCATGTRKALSTATAATELAVKVTRDVCHTLAVSGCTTNPCPALATCHAAEGDIALAAEALTRGARRLNEVLP